jgi:hypothetical protein
MGIKRCIELSPSKIEKKELKNLATRISRIDDDTLLESTDINAGALLEDVRDYLLHRNPESIDSYSIMEAVKNDIIDIALEKDNYNEPDAMPDLLGKINSKLSAIQDYVDNDSSMTKDEYKQWNGMYKELGIMRDDISKGSIYARSKHMVNTYNGTGEQ